MKSVMFLLVFIAVVGFSVLCKEVIDSQVSDASLAASLGKARRPADVKSQNKSMKQQAGSCLCQGKSTAQKGCQCKMGNGLSREDKVLCSKKGNKQHTKCKKFILKTKNKPRTISIPI